MTKQTRVPTNPATVRRYDDELPQLAPCTSVADDLLAALKALSSLKVKGHALIDRLQFSEEGRAVSALVIAAIAKAEGR